MKDIFKYIISYVIAGLLIINSFMLYSIIRQNNQLKEQYSRLDREIRQVAAIARSIEYKSNNYQSNNNQSTQTIKEADKEIMTPSELAKYLGIEMDKVYSLVENKDTKIPYINIDGWYKFSKAAIDEWLKTSRYITTGK